MIVIIGSCIHWLRYMLTYVYKVWIEYICNIMLCYICNVIFTNFSNNIFLFILFGRIILFICCQVLLQSPLNCWNLFNFCKIAYFCLPNLISDNISKWCVELMGHFILSKKRLTALPFLDICTKLTWNIWFICIFRR